MIGKLFIRRGVYDARREQSRLLSAPRRGRYYSPAVTANNGSAVAPGVDDIPRHRVYSETEWSRYGDDSLLARRKRS